jgi:hypothetical protein
MNAYNLSTVGSGAHKSVNLLLLTTSAKFNLWVHFVCKIKSDKQCVCVCATYSLLNETNSNKLLYLLRRRQTEDGSWSVVKELKVNIYIKEWT